LFAEQKIRGSNPLGRTLDQVQPLIDEKGRVMRMQAETGKNFSTILADLDRRIKSALSGKSQENE
jgi:hypothetical protein